MRVTDYAAVLFDMDGTLVDTEPLWHAAEKALFAEHGIEWTTEDALELTGSAMPDAARVIRSRGVDLPPDQIIAALATRVNERLKREIPLRQDVVSVLDQCRASGTPTALVTMSPRVLADAVIAALPAGSFGFTIAAEEVQRGKPDPEPYLRAAEALGVDVRKCLAIEDSRPGIASALAAGCMVRSVGPLAGEITGAPALNPGQALPQ